MSGVEYGALFPGFGWRHALSSLGVFAGSAVSSGGGIGGGGLYVPLFIFLLGLRTREAIPLSKAAIFGVSLGNMIQLFRRRHPKADRPIIDFDAALVLEPTTLSGVTVGVIINAVTPSWLIDILIIAMVIYTVNKTLQKGRKQYREDLAAKRRALAGPDAPTPAPAPPAEKEEASSRGAELGPVGGAGRLGASPTPEPPGGEADGAGDPEQGEYTAVDLTDEPALAKEKLAAIVWAERRFQWRKFAALLLVAAGYLLLNLVLGGGGAPSIAGVGKCSGAYWALIVLPFFALFAVAYAFGGHVKAAYERKKRYGYAFLPADVTWEARTVLLFPVYAVAAGLVAGALGLGGGLVKSPLMLELGMDPQVVVATSSYMILFTSFTSSAEFAIFGMLRWDHAIWFCGCALLGALLGQAVVDHFVRKHRMQSIVIFILAGVMTLSALLLVISSSVTVARDIRAGAHLGFTNFCRAAAA